MTTLNEVQQQTWQLDLTHSKVGFSVKHMVITNVQGHFDNFKVEVKPSEQGFENSEIYAEIDAASVNTGVADRDGHLKSADFFNAEQYPALVFKSKSFKKVDDENYKLVGDFTIKNVTKELELDVEFGGQVKDPWGNDRVGFTVTGSIDRFDYDLTWNALLETGGAVVGKKIKLDMTVEFIVKKND
jgi:polyisoprenoid-binding protein YceI